jgi:hypothetical protein
MEEPYTAEASDLPAAIIDALATLTRPQLHHLLVHLQNLVADAPSTTGHPDQRRTIRELRPQGGRLPYGYQTKDGYPEPDPHTAPVVRRIFRLHEGGASLRSIADELNREHIAPGQRGKRWDSTSIRTILRNKACYQGHQGWPVVLAAEGAADTPPDHDTIAQQAVTQAPQHIGHQAPQQVASPHTKLPEEDPPSDDELVERVRYALNHRKGRSVPKLIAQIQDAQLRADCERAHRAKQAVGKKFGGKAEALIAQISNEGLRADREAELQELRTNDASRKRVSRAATDGRGIT